MSPKREREIIYQAVTDDEYEFPLCNCDSIIELAHWANQSVELIKFYLHYHCVDYKNNCIYIKIDSGA